MNSAQANILAWCSWINSAAVCADLFVEFDPVLLLFMIILMMGARGMWVIAQGLREQEREPK